VEASEDAVIEVNGEPVLTPDPNFGVEWPDDVRLLCARLFAYDLEEIRGRNRLGALAFEEAPEQVDAIRQIVKELSLEKWDDLPPSLSRGGLFSQLEQTIQVLEEMIQLSSTSEAPAESKERLSANLVELLDWFRQEIGPRAFNAKIERYFGNGDRVDGGGADGGKLHDEYADLARQMESLKAELDSSQEAVSQARTEAGDSASRELEAVYANRSNEYADVARKWLFALVIALPVAAALAVLIFHEVRPSGEAEGPHDYAALGLGVFLLGLLAFGVRVCAQNFRVNRHLAAVARSKQSAISTFQRLSASVADEELRSAVTLTLAQSIFAVEDTGLIDGSGDQVTLIERAVVPNLPRPK
jgi:hypothetical protein